LEEEDPLDVQSYAGKNLSYRKLEEIETLMMRVVVVVVVVVMVMISEDRQLKFRCVKLSAFAGHFIKISHRKSS
jgi:hypothetical protein